METASRNRSTSQWDRTVKENAVLYVLKDNFGINQTNYFLFKIRSDVRVILGYLLAEMESISPNDQESKNRGTVPITASEVRGTLATRILNSTCFDG